MTDRPEPSGQPDLPDQPRPGTPGPGLRVGTDRMATVLLRVARNPVSGRLRHSGSLDVALRAALLADLALAGQIGDWQNTPAVIGHEPTGDRFLEAVRDAVQSRPGVTWIRWFRHVGTDRTALRNELVRTGLWRRRPGTRLSYTDSEPNAVLALRVELDRVASNARAPVDTREATLAALAAICGATGHWPRPSAVRRDLARLVDGIPDSTTRVIVKSAATALRRTRLGRSLH